MEKGANGPLTICLQILRSTTTMRSRLTTFYTRLAWPIVSGIPPLWYEQFAAPSSCFFSYWLRQYWLKSLQISHWASEFSPVPARSGITAAMERMPVPRRPMDRPRESTTVQAITLARFNKPVQKIDTTLPVVTTMARLLAADATVAGMRPMVDMKARVPPTEQRLVSTVRMVPTPERRKRFPELRVSTMPMAMPSATSASSANTLHVKYSAQIETSENTTPISVSWYLIPKLSLSTCLAAGAIPQ